jgi:AcrR family transcriptional regulator
MARTVNATVHAVRREAFVDAAQRLMQTKGYEQMSIQDLLDELGASRGAFYHYFDSKGALLDAVVGRMVEDAMAAVEPIVDDPGLSATEKFSGLFSGIASWKAERMDLLMAIVQVWLSDGNAIVRERYRHRVAGTLTPVLATIIDQGMADGSFSATSPDRAARVLVSLLLGANEQVGEMLSRYQRGLATLPELEEALNAYPEAFERILGIPVGSLRWLEPGDLQRWFERPAIPLSA